MNKLISWIQLGFDEKERLEIPLSIFQLLERKGH